MVYKGVLFFSVRVLRLEINTYGDYKELLLTLIEKELSQDQLSLSIMVHLIVACTSNNQW